MDGQAAASGGWEFGGDGRWVACGDCRRATVELADRSVALVLTDPPYFLDGMDAAWNHERLRGRLRRGAVGGVPAGMKFDPAQGIRLYAFLRPIAEDWLRILKPGAFTLCFSQPRLAHRTTAALEDAGFHIRDLLAWRREGQAKAFTQRHFVRRRKLPEREQRRILRAIGDRKTPQLKPQMEIITLAQAPRCGTFVDNWLEHGVGLINAKDPLIEPDRFPGTLIPAPKPRERFGHLTPKPVTLLRHLIRIFGGAAEAAVVFDPFAGSGTTGLAARLEGRSFVGFEIDPAMTGTANARIGAVSGPGPGWSLCTAAGRTGRN